MWDVFEEAQVWEGRNRHGARAAGDQGIHFHSLMAVVVVRRPTHISDCGGLWAWAKSIVQLDPARMVENLHVRFVDQ